MNTIVQDAVSPALGYITYCAMYYLGYVMALWSFYSVVVHVVVSSLSSLRIFTTTLK